MHRGSPDKEAKLHSNISFENKNCYIFIYHISVHRAPVTMIDKSSVRGWNSSNKAGTMTSSSAEICGRAISHWNSHSVWWKRFWQRLMVPPFFVDHCYSEFETKFAWSQCHIRFNGHEEATDEPRERSRVPLYETMNEQNAQNLSKTYNVWIICAAHRMHVWSWAVRWLQ